MTQLEAPVTGPADQPHETALTDIHRGLGARLIEFGGWLMPVQYSGILEEHRAVRERAGLFDLSHMGELFVEGDDAGDALAAALVSDPEILVVNVVAAPTAEDLESELDLEGAGVVQDAPDSEEEASSEESSDSAESSDSGSSES